MEHPERYNFTKNKQDRNKLTLMKRDDSLPCEEALLATSYLFNVEIRVYHNITTPVVFDATPGIEKRIINLQCIAFIHFNPLLSEKETNITCRKKYINTIRIKEIKVNEVDKGFRWQEETEEKIVLAIITKRTA